MAWRTVTFLESFEGIEEVADVREGEIVGWIGHGALDVLVWGITVLVHLSFGNTCEIGCGVDRRATSLTLSDI